MISYGTLKDQTLGFRRMIVKIAEGEITRAHIIPPGWKNNLHWHIGHLHTTPRLLTHGLFGEPIGIPEDYRKWFAKGTSPATWGNDPVPGAEELARTLVERTVQVFDANQARADQSFPKPYETSVGVVLTNPAEALTFSLGHDGIHLGLLLALKRALNS